METMKTTITTKQLERSGTSTDVNTVGDEFGEVALMPTGELVVTTSYDSSEVYDNMTPEEKQNYAIAAWKVAKQGSIRTRVLHKLGIVVAKGLSAKLVSVRDRLIASGMTPEQADRMIA